MPRNPIRKPNNRRVLNRQSLVAQTESGVQNAFNEFGNVDVLLTIPVSGAGVGLEISWYEPVGGVSSAPATQISPDTLSAPNGGAAAVLVWVSRDGGLKTLSNGGISGVPFNIT